MSVSGLQEAERVSGLRQRHWEDGPPKWKEPDFQNRGRPQHGSARAGLGFSSRTICFGLTRLEVCGHASRKSGIICCNHLSLQRPSSSHPRAATSQGKPRGMPCQTSAANLGLQKALTDQNTGTRGGTRRYSHMSCRRNLCQP